MKFLCLYRTQKPETNEPPSPQQMEAMGKLIGEMSKAGVLLGTEGCETSGKGALIRIDSGKFTVTDGPFAGRKDLVSGFAVLKVGTKAEAIKWSQRFLAACGEGESEVRQLMEMG